MDTQEVAQLIHHLRARAHAVHETGYHHAQALHDEADRLEGAIGPGLSSALMASNERWIVGSGGSVKPAPPELENPDPAGFSYYGEPHPYELRNQASEKAGGDNTVKYQGATPKPSAGANWGSVSSQTLAEHGAYAYHNPKTGECLGGECAARPGDHLRARGRAIYADARAHAAYLNALAHDLARREGSAKGALAGGLIGAGTGGLVAGPPGAFVGGTIGAGIGLLADGGSDYEVVEGIRREGVRHEPVAPASYEDYYLGYQPPTPHGWALDVPPGRREGSAAGTVLGSTLVGAGTGGILAGPPGALVGAGMGAGIGGVASAFEDEPSSPLYSRERYLTSSSHSELAHKNQSSNTSIPSRAPSNWTPTLESPPTSSDVTDAELELALAKLKSLHK